MVLSPADGSAGSAAGTSAESAEPAGTSAGSAASADAPDAPASPGVPTDTDVPAAPEGPGGPGGSGGSDGGASGSVLCQVSGGVATLTLHRPAKRNAMTAAMWRRLPELLDRLAADRSVRALVLTGSGGTFCAGADIGELGSRTGEDGASGPQSLAVAAEDALAAFPRPTLAVIRGYCVGGGCQLAAACDLRFAAEGSSFGITPAKLGIVYPPSSTRRLTTLVGPATAKYLLFSAELIGAERALRTGLVDELLDDDALDGRVAEFTRVLTSRSLLTQRAAKEFADGAAGPEPDPERAAHWAGQARASGDTAEGVAAFLERRAPRFTWPG